MVSKRKPYKQYTKEFKLEALRLMETSERSSADIAVELGIRRNQLYKWKEQLSEQGTQAFKGRGRPTLEDQNETSRLRQENKRLQEENDILKKAAVFFAKQVE